MEYVQLCRDVRTYLEDPALGLGVKVHFGRSAVTQQNNQGSGRANRIVFVLGDDSGKMGKALGPKHPGQNPRVLSTLAAAGTIHVWGRDATFPNDAEKNVLATWSLYEWLVTAIQKKVRTDYVLGDPELTVDPVERGFGVEMKARLVVDAPVRERTAATALSGVGFEFTNSLGDDPGCTHEG